MFTDNVEYFEEICCDLPETTNLDLTCQDMIICSNAVGNIKACLLSNLQRMLKFTEHLQKCACTCRTVLNAVVLVSFS